MNVMKMTHDSGADTCVYIAFKHLYDSASDDGARDDD